jgi:hypothetical protein
MYAFDVGVGKWFNPERHILTSFILFLQSMDKTEFASVLGRAFSMAASEHGLSYSDGADEAWGTVGASYLGFALCGLKSSELRSIQYSVRERFGPVLLDCKWYDMLKAECLGGQEHTNALLPGADGTLCNRTVTAQLFLEMLDFCREG